MYLPVRPAAAVMRRAASRVLAAAFALAALAACTRGTTVESVWTEGASQDRVLRNVLVIGVTPNYNARCRFERRLRDALEVTGVAAVLSCAEMGSEMPLTRESVLGIIARVNVDSVLSTRLVDASARTEEGGTEEARGENYYKPVGYGHDSYYGHYGLPVTYVEFVAENPALTLRRTVVISSNLYDAQTADLVYSLDTATYDKQSQGEVIDALAAAIAKRLRRDGLTP